MSASNTLEVEVDVVVPLVYGGVCVGGGGSVRGGDAELGRPGDCEQERDSPYDEDVGRSAAHSCRGIFFFGMGSSRSRRGRALGSGPEA